jgi:hypothetical protein
MAKMLQSPRHSDVRNAGGWGWRVQNDERGMTSCSQKPGRHLRLLAALSLLLLLGTAALWVRSYFVVDVVQWGDAYVVRESDELGRQGVIGARLDLMLTAPGALYLYHRRVQMSGGDRTSAAKYAQFEGAGSPFWNPYPLDFIAKSSTARETRWPRAGFNLRAQDAPNPTSSTLELVIPMWFFAIVFGISPCSRLAVMNRRRRPGNKKTGTADERTESASPTA